MTARAFPLHEEVVAAMYDKEVDPMERNFHSERDTMKAAALMREQHEKENPTPSYRSTNLDFWKGFNVNQKFLKAKSYAEIKRQSQKSKKKSTKKVMVPLTDRTKQILPAQDQKVPPRSLTCKFPPPQDATFAEERLVYEVEDLLKFANKKNSRNYKPQPLEVLDPYMENNKGEVIYEPPNEEKEDTADQHVESISNFKEDIGDPSHSSVMDAKGKLTRESEEGLVVGELDSHVLPPLSSPNATLEASSSFHNPFQESFASNTLEKHSTVSGTIVPSLNLSGVIASQLSGKDYQKTEKHADNEGEDNRTPNDSFANDENDLGAVDQQPSFALTDGNEDFLFAKSMMDGTLATNTIMDEQTKGTNAIENIMKPKSGKSKSRQKENLKKKLKPVKSGYGDIGCSVPGGNMSQSPSRPRKGRNLTQMCDFNTVEELDAAGRLPKGGSFAGATRFPAKIKTSVQGQGGSQPTPTILPVKAKTTGGFFTAKRFPRKVSNNPAPGDYNLGRLFENTPVGEGKLLTSSQSDKLIRKIEGERTLRNQSCDFMSNQTVFGYGCSIEEHIKYGLCLDGMCGRRAKWEDVTLLSQDHNRLGHGGGLEFTGMNPSGLKGSRKGTSSGIFSEPSVSVNMNMSKKTFESIEDLRRTLKSAENPDFSPLKTASLRGDFDTVVQLCLLGADINERDKNDETILHQAVLRNYLHIIVCLTEVQGYSECLNDELRHICRTKSQGMFRDWVDLNPQDKNGNTPLHIASMRGNSLMAEVLCDAGVIPDGIKNNDGRTASDVAKTQHIFQIVKMAEAKYLANEELKFLRNDRRELKYQKKLREEVIHGTETCADEEYEEYDDEYEVFEEEDDNQDEEQTIEEVENQTSGISGDKKGNSKHANKQHSFYVNYFGTPQQFEKKQSEREKYARFLNMRR